VACGESIRRMASNAASALPSWMKPMMTLTMTAPSSTAVSIHSPRAAVTAAAASMMYNKVLWNCCRKRSSGPRRLGGASRLGPCCSSLARTSPASSPPGPVPSARSTSAPLRACQAGDAGCGSCFAKPVLMRSIVADDYLERLLAGGISEHLVGLHELCEGEAVGHQLLRPQLPRLHGLQQHGRGVGVD